MSPPVPPSPPSGPPVGTCGSRRNEIAPAPPSPPRRLTCTSSTNDDCAMTHTRPRSCDNQPHISWLNVTCSMAEAGSVARNDVDELAAAALAEPHRPVGGREQRVVAAAADVLAGVEARAALAHDDGAGTNVGTRADLHPEPLGVGITAVPGGRGALLLRHGGCSCDSAGRDRGDLDDGVVLAVAPTAPLVGLRLVGEAADLVALGLADDLGRDGRALELVGLRQHGLAVDEQHGPELHRLLGVRVQPLDL